MSDSVTDTAYEAVIFDLGGVVLAWDAYRAYEGMLSREETEAYFAKVDFKAWNLAIDGGRRFADAEAELTARFPEESASVLAYRRNFARTLTGMVPGTSAVIAELQRAGLDLVGLTNWSDELFPVARERFGILARLRDILVSGAEGMAKPDPAIFALTCTRFGLDPARTVFVDDVAANVEAAQAYGLTALRFTDAARLRDDLVRLGLLGPPEPVTEPVFHLALKGDWQRAVESGSYPWSTRDIGYEAQGFVHCSTAAQLAQVRALGYGDLADDELVRLQLRPGTGPLVFEDLDAGQRFPHLYAPLSPAMVETSTR